LVHGPGPWRELLSDASFILYAAQILLPVPSRRRRERLRNPFHLRLSA
jgi:hypothetical protein